MSSITASATGVTAQTSGTIVTWGFNSGAATLSVQGGLSVTAGNAGKINALVGGPLTTQAGVPVYFTITTNSSGYAGTFTNGARSIATTTTANKTGGGMAVGIASLNVYTKSGATATVTVTYGVNPTTNATSNTVTLTTVTGTFAKLVVKAYFDNGDANKATATKASGTLYLDVSAADAYSNTLAITGATILQVNLVTTAGSLSSATAFITSGQSDTFGSGYQVQLIAPASGSFSVTASGSYSGVVASGSLTLAIVSAYPTVSFTTVPTAVTAGIAQQVVGWANVSTGVAPTTIVNLQYSLNGASNVSLGAGTATNQFTITSLLATNNKLTVYAQDGNGLWTSATIQIPVIPPGLTFTTGTGASNAPKLYQFPNGGPQAVNSTFVNNGLSTLQIIVVANIFGPSPSGNPVTPSPTGTATVAPGATAQTFELLNGLPHGTYTVTINVYTTAYVSLSPTYTITVTV